MANLGAWQLPLIAAGVGFHLAVGWALLWRFLQAREPSLLVWAVAWFIQAAHVLGMFLVQINQSPSAYFLRDLSFALAAIAFFAGQAQMEGRPFQVLSVVAAACVVMVGAGVTANYLLRSPITLVSMLTALLFMGLSAWLAMPVGSGRRYLTRWVFFASYVLGALHATSYLIPSTAQLPGWEVTGHIAFSLLFSAAVTWQAWQHERVVRLFSHTLQRLNKPLSTAEALQESLRLVANVLHVTHGWVLLRQGGRGNGHGKWTVGAVIGFPEWTRHGINGPVFDLNRCLCFQNLSQDWLTTQISDVHCIPFSEELGYEAGRHITIPLGSDGEVHGLMVLMIPDRRIFSPADIELLTTMGEQIGLALDRARLLDELREKEALRGRLLAQLITAQEDERRRIARELHDETGQALTALVVNLDFLVRHPVDEASLRKRLIDIRDMAEGTLAEVRRVIHEMRPAVLDDLGLEAAVRWMVRRYEPSGVKVTVEAKGLEERLPGPLEITAFRLVQEACTNTIKHASATHIHIRLERQDGLLTVEVTDDGQGIDLSRLQHGRGMGLANLRERVTLAGGQLTLNSTPGKGTRIYAELPITETELPVGGALEDGDQGTHLRRPHDGAARRPHGAAV